jgi:cytochrome c peroxidase
MSLVNAAYNISFGWTKAEVLSLEQQMLEPLLNQHPVELGVAGGEAAVTGMLAADAGYRSAFVEAFPMEGGTAGEGRAAAGRRLAPALALAPAPTLAPASGLASAPALVPPLASASAPASAPALAAAHVGGGRMEAGAESAVTFENLIKAIAAFERTLIAGDSAFDHYVFRGEHDALSAQEKRGMELFYSPRAGCGACHSGFNFNGNWRDSQGVTGESAFARNGVGDQPMRVPTLRNIALTAPYMHDGRFDALEAVLDHYATAARQPGSDPKLRTFNLTADERADVIAFLHALTDSEFSGR